jgi:hypothetical protein
MSITAYITANKNTIKTKYTYLSEVAVAAWDFKMSISKKKSPSKMKR